MVRTPKRAAALKSVLGADLLIASTSNLKWYCQEQDFFTFKTPIVLILWKSGEQKLINSHLDTLALVTRPKNKNFFKTKQTPPPPPKKKKQQTQTKQTKHHQKAHKSGEVGVCLLNYKDCCSKADFTYLYVLS